MRATFGASCIAYTLSLRVSLFYLWWLATVSYQQFRHLDCQCDVVGLAHAVEQFAVHVLCSGFLHTGAVDYHFV